MVVRKENRLTREQAKKKREEGEKVVSLGGGEFATDKQFAQQNVQQFQISDTPLSRQEFEAERVKLGGDPRTFSAGQEPVSTPTSTQARELVETPLLQRPEREENIQQFLGEIDRFRAQGVDTTNIDTLFRNIIQEQELPNVDENQFSVKAATGFAETFITPRISAFLPRKKKAKVDKNKIEELKQLGIPDEDILLSEAKGVVSGEIDELSADALRLVGDIDIFGLSSDAILDYLTERKDVDELQQGINTLGQVSSSIENQKILSPEERLAKLTKLRDNVLLLNVAIKQATILDPTVKASGKNVDIEADLLDQLETINESLNNVVQERILGTELRPSTLNLAEGRRALDELQVKIKQKGN